MKKLITKFMMIAGVVFLTASCGGSEDPCACYDKAINGSELSEDCKAIVGEMTEEELKEKSNKCFEEAVDDLSGAVGI